MNFDNNCKYIIEDYLLGKSMLYNSRGSISILITLIILGYTNYLSISKNPYINQLVIPLTTFILCMIIITILSKLLISNKEKIELKHKCKLWINDPNTSENPDSHIKNNLIKINLDEVSKYNGTIDGWHLIKENEQVKQQFEIKDFNAQKINNNFVIQDPYKNMDTDVGFYPEDDLRFKSTPLENNFFNEDNSDINAKPCLLGNGCGSLCSGTGVNKCNVVAPIPGPQWQPQTAAMVQHRLNNKNYVPSRCNI